jgi:outer membrane protein assembly factor BamB
MFHAGYEPGSVPLRRTISALCIWLAAGPASAQDWPQFRGPGRDGVVPPAHLPDAWPASVRRLWRLPVGEGHSSPLVGDGRVFLHSRQDPDEVVTAIDVESGRIVWQQTYAAPFKQHPAALRMGKGPNSTPVLFGDHLYTLGVTGLLSAWRIADGTLVWRKDFSDSIDTSKNFCGTAMSPLVEDGALIVQVGSDVRGGRIMALDAKTGGERWVQRGPGPGYASPIAITAAGVRQVVIVTGESILAVDPTSGAELWSVPFPDEYYENIVTPVWTGRHLVIGHVRLGIQAFTISNKDGRLQAEQAWKNPDVTMYMSAPVAADETVYGFSNKRRGQLVALNAATGAVRWATRGREGEHASILLAPSHVLFLRNDGELVVVKREPAKFAAERRIEVVDGESWAVPAPVPGGLVVREGRSLVRIAWGR